MILCGRGQGCKGQESKGSGVADLCEEGWFQGWIFKGGERLDCWKRDGLKNGFTIFRKTTLQHNGT